MAWPKGKKHTREEKKKISKELRKYYSNPQAIKKARKVWSSPTYKKKLSLSLKKYFSKPGTKEKASKTLKKYFQNHSGFVQTSKSIEKIDRAMTKWWKEHPNVRRERSRAVKKFFIEHPSKFRKFMKYGKNSSVLRLKTKNGFIVRSYGEQKIANYLYDNGIEFSYEKEILVFEKEGQICVPDFYLPQFRYYLEYYGGHPKAWKKKVMKNKLYEKYNIPYIFLTPDKLRNLKENLIIVK